MLPAASSSDIVLLFAGAGLVLYVASRAAVDALTPTNDPSPLRMALGQWMPIAFTALLATIAGHSEIGVALALASSVAVLALNLGVLLVLSNDEQGPIPAVRAWPFIAPAAVLIFLAGFSSHLTFWHAIMLLVLGVTVARLWKLPPAGEMIPVATPVARHRLRPVQLLLALGLGAVGAWIAFQAIISADARTREAAGGLVAACVMAPLLVLPVMGTGAIASQNGKMSSVMSTIVGITLLNLCALLPLVILVNYGRSIVIHWNDGTHDLKAIYNALSPVTFQLGPWRVDTVLLIVLGLMLVPVSLGRWRLRKVEGVVLAFGYVAYLVVAARLSMQL